MNILIIGSGGREHALAWKIHHSPLLKNLYAIPGNPGISELATCFEKNISDHEQIFSFCKKHDINLVVVGPETPLTEGLTDHLRAHHIPVFGPSKEAAKLESSKIFTKNLCQQYGVKGAYYETFSSEEEALHYIKNLRTPIVIKLDGLAAGKGVVIAETHDHASKTLHDLFTKNKHTKILIEEYLNGEELSFFCITDGETVIPFGTAQDHKRLMDGDIGPNTGGMGAYSPASNISDELETEILDKIIKPTLKGLNERNTPFQGILYAGLMLTSDGPYLIEYNARFGDPECQILMLRLNEDLVPWLNAAAQKTLHCLSSTPRWSCQAALCVSMTAEGYPEKPRIGDLITPSPLPKILNDCLVFHAGTKQNKENQLITNSGRVLTISALAPNLKLAYKKAYQTVHQIHWNGVFFRNDIGAKAISHLQSEKIKDN